ncbi:unnamed protein product [Rhodiola kirilowii]
MSVAAKLPQRDSRRAILGPGGNTFITSTDPKRTSSISTKEVVVIVKKAQRSSLHNNSNVKKKKSDDDDVEAAVKLKNDVLLLHNKAVVVRSDDGSVESLCSSDSCSATGKKPASDDMRLVKRRSGSRSRTAGQEKKLLLEDPADVRRCHWITPHSDRLYITFHDEEWGVPVHDDNRLFELLVFSQALAEISWPAILHKRDTFRKYFKDFDAPSVAQINDAKLMSLESFLSKPKVEAIVENAKQIVKVQREFGSFNNYCWNFVNHKPIRNSIRYANQIPAKSPKSLLISKDMMQRGFRCVGPTVIYSFMEVAGIVNDHLVSCFRYQECTANIKKSPVSENEEIVS